MALPVLPEGRYVELSGDMRLHYHDLPAVGLSAGCPVLFLQGSGAGASGWSNFQGNAPAFNAAGHRVLVIDLPGYGYSSKPTDVAYTLDYFINYVHEFVLALGLERLALVGNSLGGAIALGFALNYPALVDRLILMAPGGLGSREDYLAMPGMKMMKEVFMGGAVSREVLAQFIRSGLVYDPAAVSELMVEQRWQVFQQQNDHVMKTMVVPDMTERLPEIACPVLVFWGIDDRMMPPAGILKLATGLRRVRLLITSQCGHWFMVEHPRRFNRTGIEFLSEPGLA